MLYNNNLHQHRERLTYYNQRLFCVLNVDVVNLALQFENFFGLDLYVGSLALDVHRQYVTVGIMQRETNNSLTFSSLTFISTFSHFYAYVIKKEVKVI